MFFPQIKLISLFRHEECCDIYQRIQFLLFKKINNWYEKGFLIRETSITTSWLVIEILKNINIELKQKIKNLI